MKARLGYSDFFDDEPLKVEEYLSVLNSDQAIRFSAFLIMLVEPSSKISGVNNFLEYFFEDELPDKLKNIKYNTALTIKTAISSYGIAEQLIMRYQQVSTKKISDKDVDYYKLKMNVFKAYLVFNSKQVEYIEESDDGDFEDDEKLEEMVLLSSFRDYDILNYSLIDVFIVQIVKSIEFFNYLDTNHELKSHLDIFLKEYNVETWAEWIENVIVVLFRIINCTGDKVIEFSIKEDLTRSFSESNFIDMFCLTDLRNVDCDFISLRSKPIVKLSNNKYRVISRLFMVEKLYKSIVFEFSRSINDKVDMEKKVKDFNSYHAYNFSEQTLLYSILPKCFPRNKKWIHFKGVEFKNMGYDISEPDYYLRFKNKIFIFENKNVFINGSIKQKGDYNALRKELEIKFYKYKKSKWKKVGIGQVLSSIKKVLENSFKKCDDIPIGTRLVFYPIIVVNDRQFDAFGVNKLVDRWFNLEAEKIRFEYNCVIHNITVINIDTLILYHKKIQTRGRWPLDRLIEKYHRSITFKSPHRRPSFEKYNTMYLSTMHSFASFCEKEFEHVSRSETSVFVREYMERLN